MKLIYYLHNKCTLKKIIIFCLTKPQKQFVIVFFFYVNLTSCNFTLIENGKCCRNLKKEKKRKKYSIKICVQIVLIKSNKTFFPDKSLQKNSLFSVYLHVNVAKYNQPSSAKHTLHTTHSNSFAFNNAHKTP